MIIDVWASIIVHDVKEDRGCDAFAFEECCFILHVRKKLSCNNDGSNKALAFAYSFCRMLQQIEF